jgi:hypothetical protein
MTDVSLADAVAAFERRDLAPETRQVVDEAARLLDEGRDIEAQALVEKAEALATRRSCGAAQTRANPMLPPVMIAPIAEKLAAGFTQVLTSVLEEIYQHTGDRVQTVASRLEERLHGMEATERAASGLEERLAQFAAEHRERMQALSQAHEETCGAVRTLQQADLDARVRAVEHRVTLLEQMAGGLEPQIAAALARLDRHTDALRWLEQRQTQRALALNQFLDTLGKLQEPETGNGPMPPLS